MSIEIGLPEAIWEELAEEAKHKGLSPEEHAALLLDLGMSLLKRSRNAEARGTAADPHAVDFAASYATLHRELRASLTRMEEIISKRYSTQADARAEASRDPELVARVRNARGKFRRSRGEPGSEELHRERQVDKEREERIVQGHGG